MGTKDRHDHELLADGLPVLVVDADQVARGALTTALERAGYRVMAASSGEQAYGLMQHHRISALVVDQALPGMSGLQLCSLGRLGWPRVPRVLTAASADRQLALQAINRGEVARLLVKPVDPELLLLALGRIV